MTYAPRSTKSSKNTGLARPRAMHRKIKGKDANAAGKTLYGLESNTSTSPLVCMIIVDMPSMIPF